MTDSLTPKQQEALKLYFGLLAGSTERRFRNISVPVTLNAGIPEATLLHCGGAASEPFWEARGLKGYRAGRAEQERQQQAELVKVVTHLFDENGTLRPDKVNAFLAEGVHLFNRLLAGSSPFDVEALADKKVVLVLGFWRSMGTLMLWRVLRLVGMMPATLNSFMLHDNMPDLGVLERHAYFPGQLDAYLQFCQYLAWAKGAFAGHPVLVQKNSSHVYWLRSMDSLLGDRATYQFTLRHPVPSAISLVSTTVENVEGTLSSRHGFGASEVWWKVVERATGMERREWDDLTVMEKAIEHWAAYHVLTELDGRIAKRFHVLRFGDDLEEFLTRTLPYSVDAPPEGDEVMAHSQRGFDQYMTPAVSDRSAAAIARAQHHFATFGIELPDPHLL